MARPFPTEVNPAAYIDRVVEPHPIPLPSCRMAGFVGMDYRAGPPVRCSGWRRDCTAVRELPVGCREPRGSQVEPDIVERDIGVAPGTVERSAPDTGAGRCIVAGQDTGVVLDIVAERKDLSDQAALVAAR